MKQYITGIKIYTMAEAGVIDRGYVAIENGKIAAVGAGEPAVAEGDAVIRETGRLFPGFIDGHTHIGILEDSLRAEGDDVNEATNPNTAQLRGWDAINPLDRCFGDAMRAGVTLVGVGPGSANPIGGQFVAMKTVGQRVDDMIVKAPVSMKFALGENPKFCYSGKGPSTRMATASIIREALLKAQRYADKKDKAAEPDKRPEYDAQCEALEPVIRGELSAHFHCHRADDIFTAVRIAEEFRLKYKLVHCTEGHLIAQELAKADVEAFIGPNLSDRSKPELRNMTFANAGILADAGIKVSITTDHPVTPLEYLPVCAALAAREGLGRERAYRALTINAAEMLGLADRVGSIEVGKDADFAIFDGDPLDVFTRAKRVYINGVETYRRAKH